MSRARRALAALAPLVWVVGCSEGPFPGESGYPEDAVVVLAYSTGARIGNVMPAGSLRFVGGDDPFSMSTDGMENAKVLVVDGTVYASDATGEIFVTEVGSGRHVRDYEEHTHHQMFRMGDGYFSAFNYQYDSLGEGYLFGVAWGDARRHNASRVDGYFGTITMCGERVVGVEESLAPLNGLMVEDGTRLTLREFDLEDTVRTRLVAKHRSPELGTGVGAVCLDESRLVSLMALSDVVLSFELVTWDLDGGEPEAQRVRFADGAEFRGVDLLPANASHDGKLWCVLYDGTVVAIDDSATAAIIGSVSLPNEGSIVKFMENGIHVASIESASPFQSSVTVQHYDWALDVKEQRSYPVDPPPNGQGFQDFAYLSEETR